MVVVKMFLTAFVEELLDRLASRVLLEFETRLGIRPRLKKLEENLKMITKVINHAENMLSRKAEVDEWLEELRDWAYDADDFLDEVNTRAMQEEQQMKEEEEEARRDNSTGSSSTSVSRKRKRTPIVTKVRDLVCGFISGKHSKGVDELNSRLDSICGRMDEMRRLMNMATATATDHASTPLPILQRPLSEATAHAFDPRVFGREQEKGRIIEQLLKRSDTNVVEVIPIVGMPGIGKTTLARHVFDSVQRQQPPPFDIYGWVCVSDDFDVKRTSTDILQSFMSGASDRSGVTLNQLQSELKEVVGGKKFLLVLDDVWTRKYDDWKSLRSPFGVGAPGSKILVTTRDDKVASMMQTDDPTKIHHPGPLCDDDCWSVFLQHVIDIVSPNLESEAGRFRVKILDKCKGLPLAAELLGGLLRGESPGQGWEAKLTSGIWDLSENELSGGKGDKGMLPVVMLSYIHLPPQLKRCFSYCSVLPKDGLFEEKQIVLEWMAQSLVLPERGEQLEDAAAKYFRELVSRSLFQPSPNYPSRFVMHDLINDMAEIVAGKSCLKLDGDGKIDSSSPSPIRARYSSHLNFRGLKMKFEAFESTKYLRSIHFTRNVPLELLMKLKYLRMLILRGYPLEELPEDMGDLIHLRLVDLSHTRIRRLPESTSSLYNLQTLKLEWCRRLGALPAEMRKLVNLRNLDCSGPNEMVAMPLEMGKLTCLQILSDFIVGKGSEQGVDQLKHLSHLKGSISISFLENVCDSNEAREAKLMSKEGLQSLELKWKMDSDHGDFQGSGVSFHVFEELQPHKHLEKLIINGYGGVLFPGWVGDDMFSKMRVIKLANCGKCTSLPALGKLPVLEEIQIRNMAGIEHVGNEFYGKETESFPSLKILKFEDMENWSIWSGGGCRFACLQELDVIICPKLFMSLPDGISLQKLRVRKCHQLSVALPRLSIVEVDVGECKVELMGCLKEDGGQLLPSVTGSLMIEKVDVVEAVGSALTMRMNKDVVEGDRQMVRMLGSLTVLEMACIPKLTYLPGVVLRGLPKLETLRIRRCEELTSLWKMDDGEMEIGGFLNSLRVLEVEGCCQLVWLVAQRGDGDGEGEEDDTDRDAGIIILEEEEEEKQQYLGLPCGLETLSIKECDKLEKLPSYLLHGLTSLRKLEIGYCRRLCCLPQMGFPCTLESLTIQGCESLTRLSISSSASSSSSMGMGMGGNGMPLPHPLKELNVGVCRNLESLVAGPGFTSAGSSLSLESVGICSCPKLKSLPDLSIHRRLKSLWISGCENLGELSIPIHQLTLETLGISGWPAGLHSIQQGGPNSNSLPPNLRELHIRGGAVPMTPNPNNDDDEQIFSVPLPSSLTYLHISNFKRLTPEAFENLASLESLYIWDCPELTSIPHQLLPPSLLSLDIWNCPELTAIPHQLLPPSLLSLDIRECPRLAPQFAKRKGRYWPNVKFIPEVRIDHHSIFDDN